MSRCIFGFLTDVGLPQRYAYYTHALTALGGNSPPEVKLTSPVTSVTGAWLTVTATFNEPVPVVYTWHCEASRDGVAGGAVVTQVVPLVPTPGPSTQFAIRVMARAAGSVTVTLPAYSVPDHGGATNARAASVTVQLCTFTAPARRGLVPTRADSLSHCCADWLCRPDTVTHARGSGWVQVHCACRASDVGVGMWHRL